MVPSPGRVSNGVLGQQDCVQHMVGTQGTPAASTEHARVGDLQVSSHRPQSNFRLRRLLGGVK